MILETRIAFVMCREDMGLTQTEVVKILNWSNQQEISRYEKGTRDILFKKFVQFVRLAREKKVNPILINSLIRELLE